MIVFTKNKKKINKNVCQDMSSVWIWGNHATKSLIKNRKRKIIKARMLYTKLEEYGKLIEKNKIEIVERKILDQMFGQQHQGIAIVAEQLEFLSLEDWLKKQEQKSLLIACDLIEDPHNLGAIIRTATAFGANGLLVTKTKTAPFEGVLAKSAAGALELLPIIKVSNLACALTRLKKEDFYILGLDENGESNWPIVSRKVLVLGQEGSGLRQLTKRTCDAIISIDTKK